MPTEIDQIAISRRVLAPAEDALARDDAPAASALVWDAAASAMDSIAESRGWKRESELDLIDAAFELAREAGRRDISRSVQVARTTPWLVEEEWITKDWVAANVETVKKLLKTLDSLEI